MSNRVRCFISYDYDNDADLKTLLVGQSKNDDSPFEVADWSIKEASRTWKEEARSRIKQSDQVIVICGQHTNTATGVSTELSIAKDESKPYFLLAGRANGTYTKPAIASSNDSVYKWTWDNLKRLINGDR